MTVTADLTNQGGPSDVEMEPGEEVSLYAEAGFNVSCLSVSLFLETLEFSESPVDEEYGVAFQPKSEATLFGAKIGVRF